jgi:peptidyl-prolyl cis-trans isomerase SurA
MKLVQSTLHSLLLGCLLATAPIATPLAQALPRSPVDSIAAVVDEDVILRSELDTAVSNITAQFAAHPEQLPPRDILEKQVLDRLVMMRLQIVRAQDSGIRVSDAELEQAAATIARNNNMTMDQLRERLAAEHLSYEEFQSNLRDDMTVQRLRQRYVQSQVQVSEAEVDQLLATREVGGPDMRLANIQINVSDGATPDEIAAAKAKIDEIKGMVERGEINFRAAAARYSQAQNALDGGEIGWRSTDAIPAAFATVLKQMQPGQITEALRGAGGFQIVQLEEVREAQPQKVTQYKASDILVRISDTVSAEAARQKADALHDRLVAGEDFAKVAKEASEDQITRAAGGDMGWFQADQWGAAIAGQIQTLADGELSPVFQSDVGFHIIKRTGSREQDVTDENRRNKARQIIGERKADEVYERFLRQLRADAYVESRLGGA